MKISDLIKTLEMSMKHLGDVETFLGDDVLIPDDINGGRVDVLLAEEITDSEGFGRLYSSNESILKLGRSLLV
jgi:hypothetical protein